MNSMNQEYSDSIKLFHTYWNLNKSLARIAQNKAAEYGLTFTQFSVLMFIAPHKKITQKAIGEKTFLPKSTLSQAVDGLVKLGLLHRQPVEENRRESLLTLTGQGEALVQKIRQQKDSLFQVFHSALETLSEKEYETMMNALFKISAYLEHQANHKENCL